MSIETIYTGILNNNTLNGELELDGNCIVWSYNIALENKIDLDDVRLDLNSMVDENDNPTIEEILMTRYREDINKIRFFLLGLLELDYWYFSKPDIFKNKIFFRIF